MDSIVVEQAKQFLKTASKSTKVYIGVDSRRKKNRHTAKFQISYTICIVFHINGKNGCKVFAMIENEIDYSGVMQIRLMNEVMKAGDVYLALKDDLEGFHSEIHLDINPNKAHKSSVVAQQAVGYIKGVCGVDPILKPGAFAASTCSDLWELKMR